MKKIGNIIWASWGVSLIVLCIASIHEMKDLLLVQDCSRTFEILFIICLIVLLESFALQKIHGKKKTAVSIFLMAFVIRISFLFVGFYIPTSDFIYYFNYGRLFAMGDFSGVFQLGYHYGVNYTWLAIVYGILEIFFTPTLLGTQIINCIFTALICVLIYLLLNGLSTQTAILSAVLYSVYPCSILSSQITTNHHLATLFLMLAFLLFYKLQMDFISNGFLKNIFYTCLIALALTISNGSHPSVIIAIISMIVFSVILAWDTFFNAISLTHF